jgi:hypothetical protein
MLVHRPLVIDLLKMGEQGGLFPVPCTRFEENANADEKSLGITSHWHSSMPAEELNLKV